MNRLLIDGWLGEFKQRVKNARTSIRIVSPFIKTWAIKPLLENCQPNTEIMIITRHG